MLIVSPSRGGHILGIDLLGFRVVFGPDPLELIQVMWPQNGPIPSKVVKVVHDDGHKQVQHLRTDTEHCFSSALK